VTDITTAQEVLDELRHTFYYGDAFQGLVDVDESYAVLDDFCERVFGESLDPPPVDKVTTIGTIDSFINHSNTKVREAKACACVKEAYLADPED